MMFLLWIFLTVIQTPSLVFTASKLTFKPEPITDGQSGPYYYAFGSQVRITCVVTKSDVNISDLILKHNNIKLHAESVSQNIIRHVIKNGDTHNSGLYSCCISPCVSSIPFSEDTKFIRIQFGPLPTKPSNFSCVSESWTNMICSWEVKGTDSTSNYWISRFSYHSYIDGSCQNTSTISLQFPCSCSNNALRTGINETKSLKCSVKSDMSGPRYFFQNRVYMFQIWGYNQYGDSFWNYSVLTDMSIVRLPPVEKLRLNRRSSKSIEVSWDVNQEAVRLNTEYDVAIKKRHSHSHWQFQNITVTEQMASLRNLTPYTDYLVMVRCRPRAGHYWSDQSGINVSTMEDEPSSTPLSTTGAFMRIPCRSNSDCVLVYWKPINFSSRNGMMTAYSINCSSSVQSSYVNDPSPDKDTFSSELNLLDRGSSYNVSIKGRTSVGWSPQYEMLLPKETKAPPKPKWVVVEYLNSSRGSYQLTWQRGEHEHSDEDTVTIFWCLGIIEGKYIVCQAALNWKKLRSNVSEYIVSPHHVTDVASIMTWYFGVAITRNNLSNGITWNECIFKFNGGASKPTLSVSAINSSVIEVSWHFSFCDTTQVQGKPEEFAFAYNKIDQEKSDNCTGGFYKSEPASFDSKSILLTDLDYPATYQICMRIQTRVGFSPYSDPVTVKVKPPRFAAESSLPVILGVSVVIIIIVIFCMAKNRKLLLSITKVKIDFSLLHEAQKKRKCCGYVEKFSSSAEKPKVTSSDMTMNNAENVKNTESNWLPPFTLSDSNSLASNSEVIEVTVEVPNSTHESNRKLQQSDSLLNEEISLDSELSTCSYVKVDTNGKPASIPLIMDENGYRIFQNLDTPKQDSGLSSDEADVIDRCQFNIKTNAQEISYICDYVVVNNNNNDFSYRFRGQQDDEVERVRILSQYKSLDPCSQNTDYVCADMLQLHLETAEYSVFSVDSQ